MTGPTGDRPRPNTAHRGWRSRGARSMLAAPISPGDAVPSYHSDLAGTRHRFADLRALLAAASPLRSGDVLAGLAAGSAEQRVAARFALADLPLAAFLDEQVVPYEVDEVTRLIVDRHDVGAFGAIAHLTVGGFREWLLANDTDGDAIAAASPGITPEMAGAVSKLMRNQDLIAVARKIRVVTPFRTHDRLARPLVGAAAAQSSDRRPRRHRRLDPRRAADGRGRRGDRDQPGHRQCRDHDDAAAAARRDPAGLCDPDAELRARARHHDARSRSPRRTRRSVLPVDRGDAGGQYRLRDRSRAARRRRATRRCRWIAGRSGRT